MELYLYNSMKTYPEVPRLCAMTNSKHIFQYQLSSGTFLICPRIPAFLVWCLVLQIFLPFIKICEQNMMFMFVTL
jgi:hypothetical protein